MSETRNNEQHLIQDAPLVEGNHNFSTITDKISSIVENNPPRGWTVAFFDSIICFNSYESCNFISYMGRCWNLGIK